MAKRRFLLRFLAVLAVLLVAAIAVALFVYPPEYLRRTILYRESDVGDVDRFPRRMVEPSRMPLKLPKNEDPELAAALAEALDTQDLEGKLQDLGTQALLVLRDGSLAYERYFAGTERDSVVTSFSVAKSFSSTLLGIAAGEGRLSLGEPITTFLPELLDRDERFSGIRVRDLIEMSSGVRYEETGSINGDDAKTYYWPDLRSLALTATEIAEPPRQRFHYNNYNPLLEGLILERLTGMPVAEYLEQKLWIPMGAEFRASWSLDSPGGFEKMESGINARPIDFARFGLLVLNGGTAQGREVVPPEFIRRATAPTYPPGSEQYAGGLGGEERIGYGLHWWTIDGDHGTDFAALGKYAQVVYVSPAAGIVVARNGSDEGMPGFEWMRAFYELASEVAAGG